ncbi:cell growth regulator with RING finger domain protein 1 [Melanotaenia boesemani]|uniref:cell growth regulator with RING finger domain protein 1 n=1 Tax=Melanotaenia boesemani TaxID=1250792 RepID=UPI001C05D3D0|nr:cell growth regulator with RING finger domain protein 1 [Melanotaenia boesemani]
MKAWLRPYEDLMKMATLFLATLYEYSPLFSIAVVSLCFFVTAAMLLGWFGFDVPVILRSHDDESITPTPEKAMVQVTNPFALELGSGPASVLEGVSLRPQCLQPCILSCFWGCEVSALQVLLQDHQQNRRLRTPQHFQQALHLHYQYHQNFHIGSEDSEERRTLIPANMGITDFGPLPRQRYPLVSVLTVAKTAHPYSIVSSVTVLHVPDERYQLSARVLFQYLLTSEGNVYELKPLFMSADSGGPMVPPPCVEDWSEDGDWSEGTSRDCVVCQNAAVNRVLLPCRHACVCDQCVSYFQHCPICRAFVMESFILGLAAEQGHQQEG